MSLNNVNNNASVVNVGRTTPVSPGPQPASKSIPVVVSTDQDPVPVVEQNKIQSEVALSLLGIPRSEVALGIFADVNTYDVNPSEWSSNPSTHNFLQNTTSSYAGPSGIPGPQGWGIKHLPEESGALVEAPADETAVLTSKRFFRYQPGRVSSATFGVKSTVQPEDVIGDNSREPLRNPGIRKFGIFDKFDGYYWETRDTAQGDQFGVVRRTQSILRYNPLPFGSGAQEQTEDHALGGKPPSSELVEVNEYPTATRYLSDNRYEIVENSLVSNVTVKCRRDVGYFIDAVGYDITLGSNYNATFQGLAESNSNEYPLNSTVVSYINQTETDLKALADVNATADTEVGNFFTRLRAVAVDSGTRVDYNSVTQAEQIAFLKGITFTNPTNATASQIAVKDRIQANYDFIAEDVIQYVNNTYTTPVGYNENKCKRDVLFAINAAAYDVLYGGNSATHDSARFFFYDGFDKSDQSALNIITQTVGAYDHLISIIGDIVQNVEIVKQTNNNLTQDRTGTNANSAEATDVENLITIIRNVINEGDILDSLPADRTTPDTSWAAADYTTAQAAMQENKTSIIDSIVGEPTFSSDDLKCIRDLDFAIDAYINDLKWGGNAHTIVNATTYRTALLTDAEREGETHYTFRNEIRKKLHEIGESEARTKIGELAAYMIQTVTANGTPGSKYPPQTGPGGYTGLLDQAQINAADYGSRNKIRTIFSIYDKYLGYLASEALNYDTSVTDETTLKFKCLRDVKFIVNAYAKDLQGGGNASTVYNAKKYYSNGSLQIYTQTSGGVVSEIARHEYIKDLIGSASPVEVLEAGASAGQSQGTGTNIDSVFTLFGLTSLTERFNLLADIIIDNFSEEYEGVINYGSNEQFGDLVILRDGLIMTHAAVYDPSLLKPAKKAPARVSVADNLITTSGDPVIIGQYVNYYGDAGGLVDGKTYYVSNVTGPKENILELVDPLDGSFPDTITPVTITSKGTTNYIETPVPFIFPDEYNNTFTGGETKYDGMFPYMYSESGVLPRDPQDSKVGFIDTAIDTSTDAATLKEQIDALNLQYKSWVRDHVDPTYYSVYEYRVPRSRFSGDSLDGETRRSVYSDNVLDKKAGENYVTGGLAQEQTSVWDMDFSKVTMLKVEFSWYGAVGALFLAYVPVGNGEARWVRVHHLRASNQLKISSLGNATLPITYMVYGGGSEYRFGLTNNKRVPTDYSSYSENIVKYGASYYIDGGDRGTVRLYNHSSDVPVDIYGSRYNLNIDNTNAADPYEPYIDVTGFNGAPAVSTYYIDGRVITGNSQDQNVKVIWVDSANNRLYLNKPITQVSSLSIIVNRPALIYGLKTKDVITSGEEVDVRNRVQVYPTRLSVGCSGTSNAKLTLLKTPAFQTNTATVGSLLTNAEIDITQTNIIPTDNTDYLSENGDITYGYFRGYLNGSTNFIKILGRLEKTNDQLYFYPYEIFNGSLIIESGSDFLKEGIFDPQGNEIPANETVFEKERLSSIEVSERATTPIPGTGTELASYYVSPGAQDFDLATYFDYNKEYISYPLTDVLETLYLASYSNAVNSESELLSISSSLTWEEQ